MSNQENANIGQWGNVPQATQNNMPEKMQQIAYPQTAAHPVMQEAMTYRAIYPEIYYKLKPYIVMACDVMDSCGAMIPTQQQVEQMSDGIYDDVCKMYPDMADYMSKSDNAKDDPPDDPPFFRGGFRPGLGAFRRRGLGRDFIEALLLSELFGRRRYYY
jgi:hypothetical protein